MSGGGEVQRSEEADPRSPQAGRPLDPQVGVRDQRQPAAAGAASQCGSSAAKTAARRRQGRGRCLRGRRQRDDNSLSAHQWLQFLFWVVCLGGSSGRS